MSRFTTWAYKFALLEAGVKGRRRAWQNHELSLDPEGWYRIGAGGPSAQVVVEDREALATLCESVRSSLTPHQREVFTALALNGIPIDVLAERRGTTRGALYKTLHDARRKLRLALMEAVLIAPACLPTSVPSAPGRAHRPTRTPGRAAPPRPPPPMTIVYAARDREHNNAVVLAELLRDG